MVERSCEAPSTFKELARVPLETAATAATTGAKPIKVLHVMDKLSVDGSGIHGVTRAVSWWLPRFDPQAFQFHVCCLRGPEPAAEVFEQAGVSVSFLSKSKVDPSTVPALMKVIAREEADILHLHGYGATNFGRLAGFLKGLPRILHEHAVLPNQPAYQTPGRQSARRPQQQGHRHLRAGTRLHD